MPPLENEKEPMMPPLRNDEVVRLAELARMGDQRAFDDLFQRFKDEIYRYIRSLVSDVHDADDLFQDAFLCAWEHLAQLKEAAKFKSWLYAIAHNVTISHQRQQEKEKRRRVLLGEQEIPVSEESLEERLSERELLELALKELPLTYRACLLLQVVGGFSPFEVAEQLGISKGTVITYTCYARRQLHQAYSRLACLPNSTDTAGGRRSGL
jgi:RNA polymerase sigma-70 factor (ECF subfamily)